ncbi:MAG: nickel pincer cofactor biosynthesis protein LarB [Candidatus Woesearchaeota archaeon]
MSNNCDSNSNSNNKSNNHNNTYTFKDIGYAKVDIGRTKRRGFPEVIFCDGKTPEQIEGIFFSMVDKVPVIIMTRLDDDKYQKLSKIRKAYGDTLVYNRKSRIGYYVKRGVKKKANRISRAKKKVLILAAGTADIPIAEEAKITSELFGCKTEAIYDVGVAGLDRLLFYRSKIEKAEVIIVVAGMDGALVPVVSGLTRGVVIAVPTSIGYGASLGGLSALLTMLNSCSPGWV